LQELYGSLLDYEEEARAAGEPATLESFLERVSLQSDQDGMKDAPRVTLMTVHGAKGLEFEIVLLTGMEEEMFPYRGLDPGGAEELEEERRLAYVAITRARHRLIVTHTQTRQIFGTTRWGRPSRFLSDMPADVVRHTGTSSLTQSASERFIDRSSRAPNNVSPWRHPQRASTEPTREVEPGERYVDHEFFGDDVAEDDELPLRRGSRVRHERFGDGEVRSVVTVGEPAVVAFFPGWGEKKILARFLKRA
jgi:DNA helicase-2/ATP-dependent DNA helicase PcrA